MAKKKLLIMKSDSGSAPTVPGFLSISTDEDGNPKKINTAQFVQRFIFLLLILAIGIAMFVIGVLNLDNCGNDDMRLVPVYLVGAGALNILSAILQLLAIFTVLCWARNCLSDTSMAIEVGMVSWFMGIIAVFTVIFFVFGSIFVFL